MTNASPILYIKRHDTAPDLKATLTDNGVPVDLTTATLIRMLGQHDTDLNVNFARTVTGNAQGVVTMPWQASDTAVPGLLNVEVECTFPDGKVQTFPGKTYLQVLIVEDLG